MSMQTMPGGLGPLAVVPYPVPHDFREPCQFLFRACGCTLGLLTDTGYITPHIAGFLQPKKISWTG
jgi:phosphoribosyl 1,2-cyclic phosphodiesterase